MLTRATTLIVSVPGFHSNIMWAFLSISWERLLWLCLKYISTVLWHVVTWSPSSVFVCWIPAFMHLWRRWRESWGNCFKSEKSEQPLKAERSSQCNVFFLYSLCRQCLVVERFLLSCRCLKCCYTLVVMLHGLKRNALNGIGFLWLEEQLAKQKKICIHFQTFYSEKKYWSHSCLIVAIYSGPSLPPLMQVHFHRNTHGYIVLKEESCSYSSEFCYASFQVIPQY